MRIEAKLEEMGLVLPEPARLPPGVRLSFVWVRARGDRVYVSGHGPLNPDGSPAGPFGKVEVEVSPEEGYGAVRLTALSMLGSLKRELGDLDWVSAWLVVHGMVNAAPDFRGRPTSSTASRTGSWSSTTPKPGCTLARPWAWPHCRSGSRSRSPRRSKYKTDS